MRTIVILSAVALSAFAAPASAAFTFDLNSVPVSGVTTTTVIQTGCSASGICSVSTSPFAAALSGSLDGSVNSLEGTFSLSGFNLSTRLGYTVTLSFLSGVLQSTSLTGTRNLLSGFCPTNCIANDTTFGAQSFAINVTNSLTGVRAIVAPVPEPTSWALMLIGFGAMGVSLRRRRRTGHLQIA